VKVRRTKSLIFRGPRKGKEKRSSMMAADDSCKISLFFCLLCTIWLDIV